MLLLMGQMNKITVLCFLLLFSRRILGAIHLNKLPLYDNLGNAEETVDPFFIHINDAKSFNTWLNCTNYITTFNTLMYFYDSSKNDEVDSIVIGELELFSKYLKDSSNNVLNKNCFIKEDENYAYAGFSAINENEDLDMYLLDEIFTCQEEVKLLVFVVDVEKLIIKDLILDEASQRIIIFPPSMRLIEYHNNKNTISNAFDVYEQDLFEDDGDEEEERKKETAGELSLEDFINQSKFTILKSKYQKEETSFYEYENLSLRHMVDNYSDWKFQLWDYLARVLLLRISIPKTVQEKTSQFLYYFVIFFIVLIVIKKKVFPYISKDNNIAVKIKVSCMIGSFAIILTSITGYQFVRSNSVILLARDNETDAIVYFAGSFNWQFGIEVLIVSIIYSVLSLLVFSIIKKGREEEKLDGGESDEYNSKQVAVAKLLSLLVVLYIINYLSHNVLTLGIFKPIKYNGNYAY